MRVTIFIVMFASVAFQLSADSRAWPPGPILRGSQEATEFFVFEPVLENREVVGTKVMRFRFDERYDQYLCDLRTQVNVWLEPDYAFSTADRDRVVLISRGRVGSDRYAVAVFDFSTGGYVFSKELDDIFPSRRTTFRPDWVHSVSTTPWVSKVYVDRSSSRLHITTEASLSKEDEESEDFVDVAHGPAYEVEVDLRTLQITVNEKAQPGATDNPGDAQRLREDH